MRVPRSFSKGLLWAVLAVAVASCDSLHSSDAGHAVEICASP
jgi:hypothetical protein